MDLAPYESMVCEKDREMPGSCVDASIAKAAKAVLSGNGREPLHRTHCISTDSHLTPFNTAGPFLSPKQKKSN